MSYLSRIVLSPRSALLFLAFATTSYGEVSESVNTNYYTATAAPSRTLLESLNAASPIRHEGQIYHAYTRWYVQWDFRWFEEKDGSCRITRVATDLSVTQDLPKLINATPAQQAEFARYLAALRRHERGHYDFGRSAAVAIEHKIGALPVMASCQALESAANSAGDETLSDYREQELNYDAQTGYGKSQGAWLN